MNQSKAAVMLVFSVLAPSFAGGAETTVLRANATETFWETVETIDGKGWATLSFAKPSSKIELPTPLPNITSATIGSREWAKTDHISIEFNNDATKATLLLPDAVSQNDDALITLRFAEQSQQFPNGRIVFSAIDAEIIGETAKLETHPGNHRIGFWSDANDYVQWKYKATRPCKYTVQLTYSLSLAGKEDAEGSTVEISIADKQLKATLPPTTSWYRYTTINVGDVYLPKPTNYSLAVKCVEKRGGAVMNLKAVTLVPTCEGTMPTQSADGTLLLHSKDVTANGILLQWEPRDIKRTLGYWANPNDYAYWDFTVEKPGKFDVQILQGCGKGHGGSVVNFDFHASGDDEKLGQLTHTVIDTGHWQAFEPKKLGTIELGAGKHRLRVAAVSKAKGAVMDLRQVLLTPKL